MNKLVDRLADSLHRVDLRLGSAALRIDRTRDGYLVHLERGGSLATDAVIVAIPAFAAAQLLEGMSPEAARDLLRIQYASSAVAVLVYDGGVGSVPTSGSGFLVPSRERRALSACTWFTKKWPAASPVDGRLVLRCFVGRAGRDVSLERDDEDLIGVIDAEVRHALKLTSQLQTYKLYRWERGLPHYRVGHVKLVEQIGAALAEHPGLELAGAAYRGSGLPDCVRQGRQAAAAAMNFITGSRG
jgi:oxygen-dependent protoporphyrinogen oxidase